MVRIQCTYLTAVACFFVAGPSSAQTETTSFTYDALGRVVEVQSARSAETVDFDYAYDDADNRTAQVITEQTTAAVEIETMELALDPAPADEDPPDSGPATPGAPQR